jgi:sulfur transfer complex TusBCD TusB component (DsrH family)
MKTILHIVKDPNNKKPFELIRSQARGKNQTEIRLVLIQEAVRLHPDCPATVYILEEDLQEKGLSSPYTKISYSGLLDLIFNSEAVVNW